MKTLAIFAALSCAGLYLVRASDRLTDSQLTVHEWGTFTSVAGPDGKAEDWNTLGCGSDLPHFVNDYGFRNWKARLSGTVRMETPVLYFYSPRELTAHVKVSFPEGVLTEWYPKADPGVYQNSADGHATQLPANLNGFNSYLLNQTGVLEWSGVKVEPGSTTAFPVETAPSRYYAARATDAASLSVGGQHEKFLFYRGVARIPIPLSAQVQDDGHIIVANTDSKGAPVVMLFENRGGSIGYRTIGEVRNRVTVDRPTLDASSSHLKTDLESYLVAQGLYPREAAAMIDTWHDSWFEEGARLIYILPQATVDAMLPLTVEPAPAHTTRVFVGRIELITPETKRTVREAIAKNDKATLALYARFLEPIGESIGERANYRCQ